MRAGITFWPFNSSNSAESVVGSNFNSFIRGKMQILPGDQFRVVQHHAVSCDFYAHCPDRRDGEVQRK